MDSRKFNKLYYSSYVDINNQFVFLDTIFEIPSTNKDYKVTETIDNKDDYENKCDMALVRIYFNLEDNKVVFLNENSKEIFGIKIVGLVDKKNKRMSDDVSIF